MQERQEGSLVGEMLNHYRRQLQAVDLIVGLRVPPEVEVEGLDINLHGETVHH